MMSTVYQDGRETRLFAKGALEVMLPEMPNLPCRRWHGTTPRTRQTVRQSWPGPKISRTRHTGCCSGRAVKKRWKKDLTLLGLAAIMDLPRSERGRGGGHLRDAGIRVMMITGDHPKTAAAIARQHRHGAWPGYDRPELEDMSDEQLEEMPGR